MDIFCLAGSVQQAQQSTHLGEVLTHYNFNLLAGNDQPLTNWLAMTSHKPISLTIRLAMNPNL